MLRSDLKNLLGPTSPPFWLRALLFAVAYFLCAEIGNFLRPPAAGQTYVIFWLPTGLYVAVLLIHAPRQWGWFIGAALPANLAFDLSKGTPPYLILAFFASNTVQAALGAWLVQTFVSRQPRLRTVKEFFGFILAAGIGSTFFGALIGAGALWAAGLAKDFFAGGTDLVGQLRHGRVVVESGRYHLRAIPLIILGRFRNESAAAESSKESGCMVA
ncbi:MAG: MASE1 domain-containing protein [Verrucomicrobiota bacterium]